MIDSHDYTTGVSLHEQPSSTRESTSRIVSVNAISTKTGEDLVVPYRDVDADFFRKSHMENFLKYDIAIIVALI